MQVDGIGFDGISVALPKRVVTNLELSLMNTFIPGSV